MKDQPTCATCAFYHDDGHCRRFPPNQPGDKWPSMDGNRWCGEHKPVKTLVPTHKITMKDQTYTIEEVSKLVAQISVSQREIELLHARIAVLTDACQWAGGQLSKRTRPDPIDRALHPENECRAPESQPDPEA